VRSCGGRARSGDAPSQGNVPELLELAGWRQPVIPRVRVAEPDAAALSGHRSDCAILAITALVL